MPKDCGAEPLSQFGAKWEQRQATERSAAHEHLIDLCEMLGAADAERRSDRKSRTRLARTTSFLDNDFLHDWIFPVIDVNLAKPPGT